MKIPSTKRVCFVGWPQQPQHASAEAQANRQALFDRGRAFAPRAPQSQHTFQVPRSLQDEVIALVAEALLSRNPAGNTNGWRCGGSMTLGEAAELVGPSRLKQLKTECGGLQTVLRRQHQTFDGESGIFRRWQASVPNGLILILSLSLHKVHGGTVKIRNWAAAAEERKAKASKPLRWKQRLCWFFLHHPDGCPLQASQCAFAHGEADLRVDDSEAASA